MTDLTPYISQLKGEGNKPYLDINIENADLSTLDDIDDGIDGSTINVAMNIGMLNKQASIDILCDLLLGHEVVVNAVDLSLSGLASGVADTETKRIRIFGHELVDEAALSDATGSTYYEKMNRNDLLGISLRQQRKE